MLSTFLVAITRELPALLVTVKIPSRKERLFLRLRLSTLHAAEQDPRAQCESAPGTCFTSCNTILIISISESYNNNEG